MQQELIHKSLIRDFYRLAVNQGDISFAERLFSDAYVNHSQGIKPGKAGLIEALHLMQAMPKPSSAKAPFFRLLAEGDHVVTNLSFDWAGKQKAVIDLFRFENGTVVEHWDAVQDQPDTSLNGNALMDGPMPAENELDDTTEKNKALIRELFRRVFVDQQLDALSTFVADDLIQHKPEIANGIDGLYTYLNQNSDDVSTRHIHRVIGDGDFVVVQSEGINIQKPMMIYDIFRVSLGKVVEHWGLSS